VVDITVEDAGHPPATPPSAAPPSPLSKQASDEFWNPPSLEEMARRQGNEHPISFEELLGSFSEEDFEGFDEWLEEQRGHTRQPGERE
jgi:hypothetical protein